MAPPLHKKGIVEPGNNFWQTNGLLGEYGVIVSQGINRLRNMLPIIIENTDDSLTYWCCTMMKELYQEFVDLYERVLQCDQSVRELFHESKISREIAKLAGIDPLTATALVSAIGDAASFKNGRQVSAWLGLVPRQHSTGGRSVLLGISKRGDKYIRTLLIHGARAVLFSSKRRIDKEDS
jgi:transposase